MCSIAKQIHHRHNLKSVKKSKMKKNFRKLERRKKIALIAHDNKKETSSSGPFITKLNCQNIH